MTNCPLDKRIKETERWLLEHAEHGGIHDVTTLDDPIYMIRRKCYCGAVHLGVRQNQTNTFL
jgi:hypothetical protein